MLPKPWRRAGLSLFFVFFLYVFLAFLQIDLNGGSVEQQPIHHPKAVASKVLLWANHSGQNTQLLGHVVKRLQSARFPDVSSGRDVNENNGGGLDQVRASAGASGGAIAGPSVLARVWPSLANKTVASKDRLFPANQEGQTDAPAPGCTGDCLLLQKLWATWPPDKPKAVIYYLIQARRLQQMKKSLESLDEYFNKHFQYPVVIFHEEDLIPFKEHLRNFTSSDIYFQQVNFSIPSFLTEPVIFDIPCISAIGYRHMCRFNAKLVYEQPIMQGLEYYWRLDDDSFILRPVKFDPFVFMKRRGLVYGYQWIHFDNSDCVQGLWEATERYIRDNNIKPEFFDKWPKPRIFYNNFEISRLDVWTSPYYKKYIDYLDRLGGMFYHRWGDAPIRGLSLSLFVPFNKTYLFKEIGYQHNSFKNNVENTFDKL